VGTCGVISGEMAQAARWQRCHGARSARADEQTTTGPGNGVRTLKHPHAVHGNVGRRSEASAPSGARCGPRSREGHGARVGGNVGVGRATPVAELEGNP